MSVEAESPPAAAGTPSPRVEILGVRHHGPGSARSVLAALGELQPDLVLIEGPPELDALIPSAGSPDLVPPVAALVHNVERPRNAIFYPLANFSPEWVALRWAVEAGVAVQFADLAACHQLVPTEPPVPGEAAAPAEQPAPGVPDEDAGAVAPAAAGAQTPENTGDSLGDDETEATVDGPARRPDLIGMLAAVARYDDPERWWEDAVEHRHDSALSDFAELRGLVAMARSSMSTSEWDDEENNRREAAMRRAIRTAQKAGRQRIAFICGAFHAPALDPATFPSQASDNALLAKLPKAKVAVTWAPWTSSRLTQASGYGAGVSSPGWYGHLFTQWQSGAVDTSSTWMVKLVRLLRSRDLDAAPASVVEATRMADTLAALRGRPTAGLAELDDAALSTLMGGATAPLELVRRELVVGHELGRVPPDTPMVPLAADLARQQRALRLKRAALVSEVTLDLRQPGGLARSQLFHQLGVLGIGWAVPADTGRTTGTFKEAWQLEWQPEFEVALIEAGLYGTTVRDAAAAKLLEQARAAANLAELSAILERCLMADLPHALAEVVQLVDTQAAQHSDAVALLTAVEPLARTLRYGDVRGHSVADLESVVEATVVRACVGLRAACQGLDEDAAAHMRTAVEAAHRGVGILNTESITGPWLEALTRVGADEPVHGLVSGRVNRMLLDAGELSHDEAAKRMSRRLSVASSPAQAAAWLDGFLVGEVILLLQERELLRLVDDWISGVPAEVFDDLLPLLRRSFSRFENPERRHIGQRIENLDVADPDVGPVFRLNEERTRPAVARVAALLGLSRTPGEGGDD